MTVLDSNRWTRRGSLRRWPVTDFEGKRAAVVVRQLVVH